MHIHLWLDDIRDPVIWSKYIGRNHGSGKIVWVKTFDQFVKYIVCNGLPYSICFDHDLGEEKTGYDCCKWLIDYCITHNLDIPQYSIQSMNPVGEQNIRSLMNNYHEYYSKKLNECF